MDDPARKQCDESHKETEKITFYFNEYAVIITRCKACKKELQRQLYKKDYKKDYKK